MIAFFSVHCSKKKGGGLGLGALALAGGGGSSSSSTNNSTETVTPGGGGNGGDSTVTQCQIKGAQPVYLKRTYTLSYDCVLNTKDQGKTLTIDYESAIVELSKSSFTLPKTKKASENFTVKTKKNQAFSLTPKIDSQSFSKKELTQTKEIPIPKQGQFSSLSITGNTVDSNNDGTADEEFSDAGGDDTLIVYKDKLYYFNKFDGDYYLSTNGRLWKKFTTTESMAGSSMVIFKDKIFFLGESAENLQVISAVDKPDGSLNITNHGNKLSRKTYRHKGFVYQNKIFIFQYEPAEKKFYIQSSKDGINWEVKASSITYTANTDRLVYANGAILENKIWLLAAGPTNNIGSFLLSYDGKKLELFEESDQNPTLQKATLYAAIAYANGILRFGGYKGEGRANSLREVWFSRYGTDWYKIDGLTLPFSGTVRSIVEWKGALWTVAGGNVYKITYTE